jgi:hypothetical protein
MKKFNINNPFSEKVIAVMANISDKFNYHVHVRDNSSFHDYAEYWTIVRAGKTSKDAITVSQIIEMAKEYDKRQVEFWKMGER